MTNIKCKKCLSEIESLNKNVDLLISILQDKFK